MSKNIRVDDIVIARVLIERITKMLSEGGQYDEEEMKRLICSAKMLSEGGQYNEEEMKRLICSAEKLSTAIK